MRAMLYAHNERLTTQQYNLQNDCDKYVQET